MKNGTFAASLLLIVGLVPADPAPAQEFQTYQAVRLVQTAQADQDQPPPELAVPLKPRPVRPADATARPERTPQPFQPASESGPSRPGRSPGTPGRVGQAAVPPTEVSGGQFASPAPPEAAPAAPVAMERQRPPLPSGQARGPAGGRPAQPVPPSAAPTTAPVQPRHSSQPDQASAPRPVTVPLSRLAGEGRVDLRGSSKRYAFSLPVPARWEVAKASLRLAFVNSTALLPNSSRLIVRLDGLPLAQIVLDAASPEGVATIQLPAEQLAPGYHELEISAAQHSQYECEDASAPELWTTLLFDESRLELLARDRPVPDRLSAVADFLFDPRAPLPGRAHLAIPDDGPEAAKWAALVASGLGVRLKYREIELTVSDSLRPGVDNIVIGPPEFLRRLLGEPLPQPTGAWLAVRPLPVAEADPLAGVLPVPDSGASASPPAGVSPPGPAARALAHAVTSSVARSPDASSPDATAPSGDPARALLLVTGPTGADVTLAAQALSSLSFPFPSGPESLVQAMDVPQAQDEAKARVVQPGRQYLFDELGFETHTFLPIDSRGKDLVFRLPSTAHLERNARAVLYLKLAYSAGLRPESSLNLFLNGNFISTISLGEPKGGGFENYAVEIPIYHLKRAQNVLSFTHSLVPAGGRCQSADFRGLMLTVFGSSRLVMPELPSRVEMPRQDLLFNEGFPFLQRPDAGDLLLYLPGRGLQNVTAAANLMAMLAQKVGMPSIGLEVVRQEPAPGETRHVLCVGGLKDLPKRALDRSPLRFDARTAETGLAYPFDPSFRESVQRPMNFLERLVSDFLHSEEQPQSFEKAPRQMARIIQNFQMQPGWVALLQFESPYAQGSVMQAVTAWDAAELPKAARLLWDPSLQALCGGDAAFIRLDSPKETVSLQAGRRFFMGDEVLPPELSKLLHRSLLLVAGGAVLFCALAAYLAHRLLTRARRGKRS